MDSTSISRSSAAVFWSSQTYRGVCVGSCIPVTWHGLSVSNSMISSRVSTSGVESVSSASRSVNCALDLIGLFKDQYLRGCVPGDSALIGVEYHPPSLPYNLDNWAFNLCNLAQDWRLPAGFHFRQ